MKPSTTSQFSIASLSTADEAFSTLGAMHRQETTSYKQQDYLKNNNTMKNEELRVDESCRERMSQWCFDVVDFCKFHRETVAISMSFLDRYLMTTSAASTLQDRKRYQLASMTALYTAIKINEPEVVDPNLFAAISKGALTADDIKIMEREMLKALEWRVQPPTAAAFVRCFISILREQEEWLSEGILQRIMDYSIFQTELAVREHKLMTASPSTIAFAAIANAVSELGVGPLVDFAQAAIDTCFIDVEVCVDVRRQLMDVTAASGISISSFGSASFEDDMKSHQKSVSSSGGNCQESPSSVSYRVDAMQE